MLLKRSFLLKLVVMHKFKNFSQTQVAFLLAIYLGWFLNSFIFYRRFVALSFQPTWVSWLSLGVEIIAVFFATFFLLRIISLGGRWCFKILASLITVVCVASAYYMLVFNVVVGYGIVASVLTLTDTDLSTEALSVWFYAWVILVSIPPLALIWLNRGAGTLLEQTRHLKSGLCAWAIILFSVAIVWLPVRSLDSHSKAREYHNNRDLPSYGGVVAHSYLPSNWLSAFGVFAWTRLNENLFAKSLFDPTQHFQYDAPKSLDDTYVVFVIGETTRWDHMGIFGYSRNTTPMLEKEKNLAAFRGVSCDTATKLSLRCMFVREGGAGNDPGRTLKEENIFQVMRELGFTSELYAMQGEVWFYSKTDANNIEFREQIGSEPQNSGKTVDDMLLVPKVADSVRNYPHGKHLVILHTKGSHYLYSQRYPRSFAKYTPECIGGNDFCSKQQLINSYDNSVMYVDHSLSAIYDQLRDKKAIIFYVADHGESISDNMHFHGTPREMAPPEQFRVPMLVWASDKFLEDDDNRARFSLLQQQARAGVRHKHTDLFDSILGCLGYTSPNGGIKQQNNWCARPTAAAEISATHH